MVASRLGTLAIGIALARVLGPDQFGIFAIATLTLLAILSFNELGVSLAIIRWRDDPATIAPTINTISAVSSLLLTIVVIVGAPWISETLGDVRAAPVVQVLALSILINGLVATSAAIMQREFMQKQRTIADQVNTWLGAGLSLLFAFLGWGAMSLAVGRLIASIVFAIMLIKWSPVPYRFGWKRDTAGRLLRFGLPLAASSIVVFAAGYTDQLIVGSTLGATALGFYVLAYNLASWPVSIFSLPLRAVAPAAFSALKHDPDRMSRNFARVLAILSSVAIPACLAISGAAEPVVDVVYGTEWLPAADILLWLAAMAGLRIWFELAYDYLVVHGKSGIVLFIQLASFGISLPLMLWAVQAFGAPGVAAAQFVVALVAVVPLYLISLHRTGIRVHKIAGAVVLPVIAGLMVWVASWLIAQAVGLPLVAAALAAGVATGVIALLAFWQRENLKLLRAAATGKG
ncbi:oligosaccharide flippase family protein [Microbacterium pumilum]